MTRWSRKASHSRAVIDSASMGERSGRILRGGATAELEDQERRRMVERLARRMEWLSMAQRT